MRKKLKELYGIEGYDFSQGVQGKHHRAYKGHIVKVTKEDGTVEEFKKLYRGSGNNE